jgi:SAM-dependent methyltransferase
VQRYAWCVMEGPPDMPIRDDQLTARFEPFDSFWEAPSDIEKGYSRFYQFYKCNYLRYIPQHKNSRILVISCGPGYFVNMLARHGYSNVIGIDSFPDKVEYAKKRGLNCEVAQVFAFLRSSEPFDVIVAEQELNHLTKPEIIDFLELCFEKMNDGGTILVHAINGTSPLTGAESRAGNFDHFCSFTEFSLNQVLHHPGFVEIKPFPLDLYVFYRNPLNYVAMAIDRFYTLFFKLNFRLVGKTASIFTKKIGAVARKPMRSGAK